MVIRTPFRLVVAHGTVQPKGQEVFAVTRVYVVTHVLADHAVGPLHGLLAVRVSVIGAHVRAVASHVLVLVHRTADDRAVQHVHQPAVARVERVVLGQPEIRRPAEHRVARLERIRARYVVFDLREEPLPPFTVGPPQDVAVGRRPIVGDEIAASGFFIRRRVLVLGRLLRHDDRHHSHQNDGAEAMIYNHDR